MFPLLYERRSEWVVTKAVGGRLPEHLKAVVMCCRPRRSRAIGVYGTTLSRFCVRGVSRGSECPPPPASEIVLAVVGARLRTCVQITEVWVGVHVQCGCQCCNFVGVPPRHTAHVSLAVHTGGGRGCCHACGLPGSGWLPPPPTTCFCAGERILVLWQGEKVSCCGLCRTGHICVFPGRLVVVESEDSGQVVGALWAVSVMVATQASWFRGVVIPFRVGCSS